MKTRIMAYVNKNWNLVLVSWISFGLVVLILAVVWYLQATRINRLVQEIYVNQTLELITTLPTRAQFHVERGYGTTTVFPEIHLYGTLIVEAPDGASYAGSVRASRDYVDLYTINWTYPDGSGESWMDYTIKPVSGLWERDHVTLYISNIRVVKSTN